MAHIELEITAKVSKYNREEVRATVGALGKMLNEFKKLQTEEEIGEHVARINGYCYAMVNMGVLNEEQANGEIRKVVTMAAAGRAEELRKPQERKQEQWQLKELLEREA